MVLLVVGLLANDCVVLCVCTVFLECLFVIGGLGLWCVVGVV